MSQDKQPLSKKGRDEDTEGVVNPALVSTEEVFDVGAAISGESDYEVVEQENAKHLVKDMKSKRKKKQKELSKKLISPKDDLTTELRTAKKHGKKKLEDSTKEEHIALTTRAADVAAEDVADILAPVAEGGVTQETTLPYDDDGTVPMPADEAEEEKPSPRELSPLETRREARLARLRKKKQDSVEQEVTAEAAPTLESGLPPEIKIEPPPPQKDDKRMSRIDRIKNRVQKAKLAGENEAKKEESEQQREARQKSLRDKTTTQYDDEDVLISEKLTALKRKKLRQKWKNLGDTSRLQRMSVDQPSVDEAYDFFTRVWEPEPDSLELIPSMSVTTTEEATSSSKEKESEEKEVDEKDEKESEPVPGPSGEGLDEDTTRTEEATEEDIIDDKQMHGDEEPLLDDYTSGAYGYTAIHKAQLSTPKELEKEKELLYTPSSIAIPAREKIFVADQEPRYLEDEGFYVGMMPKMRAHNLNRLEHRLLQEPDKGRKWFGEDGRIKFIPDPLALSSSRPPITEDLEPALQTVYKKAVIKDFDSRYIDGAIENTGEYQIDIDINSVAFTHHHLFSREHVLANQLSRLYDQHLLRKRRNMVEFLTEKLRALKVSLIHLRELLITNKRDMTSADKDNYQKRLADYKYEVKHTRSLRDMEEGADRSLLQSIIGTWRDLKGIRRSNTYTNTPLKLQIRKENRDKAAEMLVWEQEVQDELDEQMDTLTHDYDDKLAVYMRDLEKFEKQQQDKKGAKKRQKKRARLSAKQEAEATSETEAVIDTNPEEAINDQRILDEEELTSPEQPDKPDEAAIKLVIETKMRDTRRAPGEPKLFPYLTSTATVTQTSLCKKEEQLRREAVSKYKMYVRVLFNRKEVSRTDTKTMSQDFTVNFGQIYNLKIVHWPESIKFEIYEESSLLRTGYSRTLLAELYAAVPEPTVMSTTIQLDPLDFSSDQQVSHQHSAVGSGVSWSIVAGTSEIHSLMTSGVLWCSVGWAMSDDGSPLVPPTTHKSHNLYSSMARVDPVAGIGISGMVDIDKLCEWVSQSRLDPNDPANADIVYLFRPKDSGVSLNKMSDHFRLEQLQEEFNFTTDEELAKLRRFQMIQLRDEEVPEFKNYKFIPCLEKEVVRDAFLEYERRKREEEKVRRGDDPTHRAAVSQFMQRVREQVMRRWRLASHQKRLEEMIVEEAVPNIAMLGINFMKLLRPRRPLRPERKERKKVTATAIKGEDIHLLVSITRAFDIPVRRQVTYAGMRHLYPPTAPANMFMPQTYLPQHYTSRYDSPFGQQRGMSTARGTTEVDNKNFKTNDSLVNPFVEVTFQRNTTSTTVAEGPNPSFNEELSLPFKAPNDDYSPGNLQSIVDKIYINLFDQVSVDILEDDRLKESNIHRRLEKKWLGNIEIPFTTVYNNGKIDGTFRVSSPPVLLGYTFDRKQSQVTSDGDVDLGLGDKTATYISMFLTIEPPLVQADQMTDRFTTNESEQLLEYADRWTDELHEKFPKRRITTSVVDVSGKTVFVTRYFKPLSPPPEVSQSNESTARFVSLVPFASDNATFPGICDIWARSDEFLSMLSGDEEEHAILLANYFLSESKEAWLVLGSAIPEGPTAYVLTTDENHELVFWNPSTGRKFNVTDSFCPLQSVWCLINADNIWANIQQYEQPTRISLDVNNKSHWKPFFTSKTPNPGLTSVQPDDLHYVPTDKNYLRDLQEKIEQTLKNKIMEWRARYVTRWNRYCTQSFRTLLPKLEDSRGEGVSDQHIAELEHFLGSYKISGFPMNMPFTDVPSIVETVYSTGVHAFDSSDVEFALAVHIHPYPNSVLSVWIYIASLIRIR